MQTATKTAPDMTLELEPQPAAPLVTLPQAVPIGAGPMAIIEQLLQRAEHIDIDRATRLLDLHRQFKQDQIAEQERLAVLAYERAFIAFRGENVIIPKTKHVNQVSRSGAQGPSFWQAEFDMVCDLLTPAMHKHGLGFRHSEVFGSREWKADASDPTIPAGTVITIPWVYVTCTIIHVDGHSETLPLDGPPDTSGAKSPVQQMQSTATQLKRHILTAMTGTSTREEDDETRNGAGFQKHPGKADAMAELDPALLPQGKEKALEGMKPLLAWWGALSQRQRDILTSEFPTLKKAAAVADQHPKVKS